MRYSVWICCCLGALVQTSALAATKMCVPTTFTPATYSSISNGWTNEVCTRAMYSAGVGKNDEYPMWHYEGKYSGVAMCRGNYGTYECYCRVVYPYMSNYVFKAYAEYGSGGYSTNINTCGQYWSPSESMDYDTCVDQCSFMCAGAFATNDVYTEFLKSYTSFSYPYQNQVYRFMSDNSAYGWN